MLRKTTIFASLALLLVLALVALGPLVDALAQGGRPPTFEAALTDLSTRLGRTVTEADFNNSSSRWEWRAVDFIDSALECPNPGEAVTSIVTPGYQFVFVLRGVRYEYRVSLADASTLRFCENPTGAIFELPTLVPVTPNTEAPAVLDAALALLSDRLGYTLTYADFDNPRSSWSWQFREFQNSQLECPVAGGEVDQVLTEGWQMIFIYNRARYDFRAPFTNAEEGLFLCRVPPNDPPRLPTPTGQVATQTTNQ
jgi:hypothetical protein